MILNQMTPPTTKLLLTFFSKSDSEDERMMLDDISLDEYKEYEYVKNESSYNDAANMFTPIEYADLKKRESWR